MACLLYNAGFQIMMSFMPSFFVDKGFELARATSLSAVSAIGLVVGVQAGGLLLKRSAHPDLICRAALAGWCVALLALSTGTAPLLWVVLGGLLGGLPAAALVSLPAEVLRPESRSAGMVVFFTVYYFGCAILPTGGGYRRSASRARSPELVSLHGLKPLNASSLHSRSPACCAYLRLTTFWWRPLVA